MNRTFWSIVSLMKRRKRLLRDRWVQFNRFPNFNRLLIKLSKTTTRKISSTKGLKKISWISKWVIQEHHSISHWNVLWDQLSNNWMWNIWRYMISYVKIAWIYLILEERAWAIRLYYPFQSCLKVGISLRL